MLSSKNLLSRNLQIDDLDEMFADSWDEFADSWDDEDWEIDEEIPDDIEMSITWMDLDEVDLTGDLNDMEVTLVDERNDVDISSNLDLSMLSPEDQ